MISINAAFILHRATLVGSNCNGASKVRFTLLYTCLYGPSEYQKL